MTYRSKSKCSYDPSLVKGPIGMFHCPECGEMVLAGVPHPDWENLDELFEKKDENSDDS